MDAHALVRGRETEILDAIGIDGWRKTTGSNHIRCPFPDHDDRSPSWRWDKAINKWTCTCVKGVWRDVYDAVARVKGLDNRGAFFYVRELLEGAAEKPVTFSLPSRKEDEPGERIKEPHQLATRRPGKADVFHHAKWGAASRIDCYTAGGKVYEARVRYDGPAVQEQGQRKVTLPWYWTGKRWVCGGAPAPRPAYRLEDIEQDTRVPVLFVEGETAVDGAEKRFPQFVATTTSGGCKQYDQTDYAVFMGRRVVIWPDNDTPGRDYAQNVARKLHEAGASEVRIVDVPKEWPKAWDLADPVPLGHDEELLRRMVEEAPAWHPPVEKPPAKEGFTLEITDEVKAEVEAEVEDEILLNKFNEPRKCAHNIRIYLRRLGVTVSYNEHAYEYEVKGLKGYGPRLDDDGLAHLSLAIEKESGVSGFPKDYVDRVVLDEGRRRRFHPVCAYLDALQWDGEPRLDDWLIRYMGAEDDAAGVNRAIGRLMLIAAVRRVRQPGCKYDYLVVLEGDQGIGKSRAMQSLCPDKALFSDCISLHMDPKLIIELASGKWIVEIGELAGMKKTESEHVKAMLSRQTDESRMAWGRITAKRPRQWIMVATTNERNYLIDETGNRRFLPVRCGRIDVSAIIRDRDKLWAEASFYEAKEQERPLCLPSSIQSAVEESQREREIADEWLQPIRKWLDDEYPDGCHAFREDRLTILDVAESVLNIQKSALEVHSQRRIARCLQQSGWVRTKPSNGKNFWRRKSALSTALFKPKCTG